MTVHDLLYTAADPEGELELIVNIHCPDLYEAFSFDFYFYTIYAQSGYDLSDSELHSFDDCDVVSWKVTGNELDIFVD